MSTEANPITEEDQYRQEAREIAARHMDEQTAAHLKGEETEAERRLRDAREALVSPPQDTSDVASREGPPDDALDSVYDPRDGLPGRPQDFREMPPVELQGYDPRKERRVKQHDPKPEPPPVTAERLLEYWYLFQAGGRLKHAGLKPSEGESEGVDEMTAAALYVESVPLFWKMNMKPILFHKLNGSPWATWYGTPGRTMAAALFESFKTALRDQMERKPFVVYRTKVTTPDHLENADQANLELKSVHGA